MTENNREVGDLPDMAERYNALYHRSREMIYVCDLSGRFLDGNERALSLFGYTKEELSQVSLSKLMQVGDLQSAQRHFARILENGYDSDAHEYRVKTKEGRLFWIEANGVRIDRDGKPRFILGIARDITARKKAEEVLNDKERQLRLTERIDAVGNLASGIAQDFNNLLGAISGYCDVLFHEFGDQDPLRKDVEEIKHAAARASFLTKQLLAFSRRQVLHPGVFNLNESINNMDRTLRRVIGDKIELVCALDQNLGNVKADPSQLEQVILNLVLNAREAMPGGGKLIIETQNVTLDDEYAKRHVAALPGEYAMVAFTDTGCGIEEALHGQIFEPFFTTKKEGKGSGLGLSTVYGVVKQSGGYIWVYSTPNVGTTFKIYLPRVEETATGKTHSKPEEAELRGSETVLVVEDDDLLRSLILRMTRLYGYEPLEARHGGEAVIVCEKYKGEIDLLLTDVMMPYLGGTELADRIRAIRPATKVLFMSGYADNAIVEQGLLTSGSNFIQKPFHAEALVTKIRETLDGKKPKKSV